MTRLERIRTALEYQEGHVRFPSDVAWLVERLDEAANILHEAKGIIVGADVVGAAKTFPNAVRANARILAALARLEEPDE